MAVWNPIVEGKTHKVVVSWNALFLSGQLFIDRQMIDTWGPSFTGHVLRRFTLSSKEVILQSTATAYDLFIDGEKVEHC